MFIVALFIRARRWKQSKSSDKWMNKTWLIHTMKYYLTIKRNVVVIHGTKWMNLKEKVYHKKPIYYMIPFKMKCPEQANLHNRKQISGYPGLEREENGM